MNVKHTRARVLLGIAAFLLSAVQALPAYAANALGIAFNYSTNAELYGRKTGMLVTGRCNRDDPKFAAARAKGAEVLVYLNAVEVPDQHVCTQDRGFYMNNYGAVPLWPYPSYGQRVNWANNHLTDLRPGSPWITSVVKYVENMMREKKFDGVFLDVTGGRLWMQIAAWDSWPQWEKDAWTDGNIELVRRLDASRRAINPKFIIVNNNVWDRGWPDKRGFAGEKYVDGVVIEHMNTSWHKTYAQRTFGNTGHRRVLVIARSPSEAKGWLSVPGVTHISDQAKYYNPSVPSIGFSAMYDR